MLPVTRIYLVSQFRLGGPSVQRDYRLVMLPSGGCELRLDGEVHTLRVGHVRRGEGGA